MNRAHSEHTASPAKPKIKKLRWPWMLVWLIPIAAAVMAGVYAYDVFLERGEEITVMFHNGDGLKAGQTQVSHLGVEIGKVLSVGLTPDEKNVGVRIQLNRSMDSFAKQGAMFWVVRPEVSAQSISGIGTVLSGPYIDSSPGNGEIQKEFTALDQAPQAVSDGLRIVVKSPNLERLAAGSQVFFRGVPVGVIENVQLSPDGQSVDVHTFIRRPYAPLVRVNSQFWTVSGVDFKGGIFSGIQMKVESLRALLSGGIAFATPEKDMGAAAPEGSSFVLHDTSKDEWLKWSPSIPIKPDDAQDASKGTPMAR